MKSNLRAISKKAWPEIDSIAIDNKLEGGCVDAFAIGTLWLGTDWSCCGWLGLGMAFLCGSMMLYWFLGAGWHQLFGLSFFLCLGMEAFIVGFLLA